ADGRSREPAVDHPLYSVLYRRANAWQTSFEFRETVGLHLSLCNAAFCFKNVVMGNVVELIPFEPQHVRVKRAPSGLLSYVVQVPGSGNVNDIAGGLGREQEFPSEAIWHLRGPSWNSYTGLDFV